MRRMLRAALALLTLTLLVGVAGSGAKADLFAEIMERGEIRVGILGTAPPFGEYNRQGEIEGFDVDLANRLAEDLGAELQVVDTTAQNRIPYLQSGRVDLIVGTFSRTVERTKVVDFSVPYAIAGPVVLVAEDNDDIGGVEDLAGEDVAVIPGIVGAIWARRLQPDANYVEYQNEADQILALRQGSVSALVQDVTIARTYVNQYPGELKVVGEPFYRDYLAIGMPKNEPNLRSWVNWFVFQMHNEGFISELWNKYFDYPEPDIEANPFF